MGHTPRQEGAILDWRHAYNGLLLRPWFDHAAVPFLVRWYFPLSRAWAAGLAAGRDRRAFAHALGRVAVPALLAEGALARLRVRADRHADAVARWEAAFFGEAAAAADLPEIEARRLDAANDLMFGRRLFARLHMAAPVPPVRFAIAPPAEVEARHSARRSSPQAAFALPPSPPAWEASAAFEREGRRMWWLRLPAPLPAQPGDHLWARVVEPLDRPCVGTMIFTHGIAMEDEHWRGRVTPLAALSAQGLRLVLPEGPGHGRRRCAGLYGGEQVLGGGPLGMLDYLHAHVVEVGLLTAWARGLDPKAAVGVGGVSLGALVAQKVATAAHHWPPEFRPDALLLVTPSRSLDAVVFDGALTCALGVPRKLADAGWTAEAIDPWLPLLDPIGPPAVDPARIVMTLGTADHITPFAEGQGLANAWTVPARNIFTAPRGHFTTSMALSLNHDPRPLARFAEVMGEGL
jgi:pimeloyl-ACP methyl ester carboxylesterase